MYVSLIPWEGLGEGEGEGGCGGVGVGLGVWGVFLKTFGRGAWTASRYAPLNLLERVGLFHIQELALGAFD